MSRLFLTDAVNLCRQPSFDIQTRGDQYEWNPYGSGGNLAGTPVYTYVPGRLGGHALRIQYTGVAGDVGRALSLQIRTPQGSLAAGDILTASCWAKIVTTGSFARGIRIIPETVGYGALTPQMSDVGEALAECAAWTRYHFHTAALPATTDHVMAQMLYFTNVNEGDTLDITIDDVLLEESAVLTPYFDGDSVYSQDAGTFAWTGAQHASTSTRAGSRLDYLNSPAMLSPHAGTVVVVVSPLWNSHDSGENATVFSSEHDGDLGIGDGVDGDPSVFQYQNPGSPLYLYLREGEDYDADTGLNTAAWAAGSTHVLVSRWLADGTMDQMVDGVPVAQAATTRFPNSISTIHVGSYLGQYFQFNGYLSLLAFCPQRITDVEAAAISAFAAGGGSAIGFFKWWARMANSGAGYPGTLVLPLDGDARGYRVSGVIPSIDVLNLIFDGCSLTNDALTYAERYPTLVHEALAYPNEFWNDGIGGQGIVTMAASASLTVDPWYKSFCAHNVCVPWAGTIELADGVTTAAQAHDLYKAYCLARKAVGWDVVAVTMLPRMGGGVEAKRIAYNTLIRDHYTEYADVLVDMGWNATIGTAGKETDETYYRDQLHPTAAGHVIIAALVQAGVELLL